MSYDTSFSLDTETVRSLCDSHIGRQDVSSEVSALLQELQRQLPPQFKVGDIVTPMLGPNARWQIKHIENGTAFVQWLESVTGDVFDAMPLGYLEMIEPAE